MSDRKEEILCVLHRSRKAFLVEYFCALVLVGSVFIAPAKGIVLPPLVSQIILGLGIVTISFVELGRLLVTYTISKTKITITQGILKQAKKTIYYHPLSYVPDINVHQSRLQHLLDFGTVFIKAGGDDNTFEIKDVNDPNKVMEIIEKLIDETREKVESK